VENLAPDPSTLHPLQAAFVEHHGLQCGYCTPGMLMSALALLESNPSPSDDAIKAAIHGNFCRCTGYQSIVTSIRDGAARIRGEPGTDWHGAALGEPSRSE
jgi:aerobic carbon-monoxide dehydrogenase small subunit